ENNCVDDLGHWAGAVASVIADSIPSLSWRLNHLDSPGCASMRSLARVVVVAEDPIRPGYCAPFETIAWICARHDRNPCCTYFFLDGCDISWRVAGGSPSFGQSHS